VRIERQVVREQVDVVAQQQAQALLHPAGDAAVLAAPEQAVVNEDGVGLGVDRGLDERPAGGHAGDDLAHHGAALDLQAVGSVVLEAPGASSRSNACSSSWRVVLIATLSRSRRVACIAWPRAARGHRASKKPSPASTAT
jgi:hypothetical protein